MRSLISALRTDIRKKFVFLSGPRQVGKTTLAKAFIREVGGLYLLYDDDDDRRSILNKEYVFKSYVCLDEFHKFPRWKAHLKGIFDKYHEKLHLLLTGSARLDVYQKSGDSLFGRYYLHHLHPLTLGELSCPEIPRLPDTAKFEEQLGKGDQGALKTLLRFGGFPEPFYGQSEQEHRRWSNARRQLLLREDMRDLTQITLLGLVEQLMLLLPPRIGSLFSYRSLSEDLKVSPQTIQSWLEIFEKLFLVYKLTPYSKNITRSLQKQPKYYLFDWSQIDDEGNRFENLVASHLYKAVQTWTDLGHANLALHFVRDRDQREADFLITKDGKPWFLVEAKVAETQVSENLRFFCRRLGVPGFQVLLREGVHRREGDVQVVSASSWLVLFP